MKRALASMRLPHHPGATRPQRAWWRVMRAATSASLFLALVAALAVSGCASSPAAVSPTPSTPQSRLSAQIQRFLQGTRDTGVTTYDASQRTLKVTITLAVVVPRSLDAVQRAQERVKSLCFQAQRAAWTSGLSLTTVMVSVRGPMYDDYLDLITSGYGSALLSSATAARFVWDDLTADSAWSRYDSTALSSEFAPFQGWDVTPTAAPQP